MDSWYLENLVCPRDYFRLAFKNEKLCCQNEHSYPVVEGVPVMLLEEKDQTIGLAYNSIKRSKGELVDLRFPDLYLESLGVSEAEKLLAISLVGKTKIDPVVSVIIGATAGRLYKRLVGKLETYPIPELRLEKGQGRRLLDMGCSWGRWSIAAYKLGYQVIGIDPSLSAIMAGMRVSKDLGFDIKYIVGDARFLPFSNKYFDVVFSYSVLQHLGIQNVQLCLEQISRILNEGGYSFIQLANKFGIISFYNHLKRKFRKRAEFEVNYYNPIHLVSLFNKFIGETSLEADSYFRLGIQASDIGLMPGYYKMIITASEILRKMSKSILFLIYLADSVYVKSIKRR